MTESISLLHLPHALQIVCPSLARRHNGVVVVPQLAQLVADIPGRASFLMVRDKLLACSDSEASIVCGTSCGDGVLAIKPAFRPSPLPTVDGEPGDAKRFLLGVGIDVACTES